MSPQWLKKKGAEDVNNCTPKYQLKEYSTDDESIVPAQMDPMLRDIWAETLRSESLNATGGVFKTAEEIYSHRKSEFFGLSDQEIPFPGVKLWTNMKVKLKLKVDPPHTHTHTM